MSKQCTIDMDDFRKTETGKPKIWRTNAIETYCCCLTPAFFVWERNTKHNGYNGYSGYVDTKRVTLLERRSQ